jgi:hypothetical protein
MAYPPKSAFDQTIPTVHWSAGMEGQTVQETLNQMGTYFPTPRFSIPLDGSLTCTGGAGTCERATPAQYTDAITGEIKTAATLTPRFQLHPTTGRIAYLQERVSINVLGDSNDVEAGSWSNTFQTSGPKEIAPNGEIEGVEAHHSTGDGKIDQVANTDSTDGQYISFSVYVKAIGTKQTPWVRLTYRHRSGNQTHVYYDLINGVVGSVNTGSGPDALRVTIEKAAHDYYRVGFTVVESVGGSTQSTKVFVKPALDDGDVAAPATIGNGLRIWGVQLEVGVSVSSIVYTPTAASVTRDQDKLVFPPAFTVTNDRQEGAYSMLVTPLANTDDISATGLAAVVLAADQNATFMASMEDGVARPRGNLQWNSGNANSMVSGYTIVDKGNIMTICQTYDNHGDSGINGDTTSTGLNTFAFSGTKRFTWVGGVRYGRANNNATSDDFSNFPVITETYVGYQAWSEPLPCLISDIHFWPLLTDAQAEFISKTGAR